jgi:3-phosphoshikimate 1-carboxyvinyltransferase
VPGEWWIDGSARLRERPIGPLAEALAALGAQIEFRGEQGCAPLTVRGGRLSGGRLRLDAGESSQYLSALLFAGQRATAPIEIEVAKLSSAPYARLTTDVLGRYGGRVEHPLPDGRGRLVGGGLSGGRGGADRR